MGGLIDPGSKVLRHPVAITALRLGLPVWPINVELDLANRCNLKCQWCDFAYTHDGAMLETSLADALLDELARGGTRAVTITGGGEPTLHPEFGHIAQAARVLGLQVGLYTNGLLAEKVRACLPVFSWVYVSLDACCAIDYYRAKGVGAFNVVCQNIHFMAAEKGPETKLGVGFLLNAANHANAPLMARVARLLGADYCQFRPVVEPGADYAWVPGALKLLDDLASETVYVSRQRFCDLYNGVGHGYTVCRGSALVPCVGAGGQVWVCPNTRGLRPLGDLTKESFGTLWARRATQMVGPDCRVACRNHALNQTLEFACGEGAHDAFV